MTALILLSLILNSALASDHGVHEGRILNRTDERLFCYADRGGEIHEREVLPGETCLGDALGAGEGRPVYKAPNHARFVCERCGCGPEGWIDAAVLEVARAKNGSEKYGWLEWREFLKVMGEEP